MHIALHNAPFGGVGTSGNGAIMESSHTELSHMRGPFSNNIVE